MKYKIIYSKSNFWSEYDKPAIKDLMDKVQKELDKGWKCQGGICSEFKGDFYQAMIKE